MDRADNIHMPDTALSDNEEKKIIFQFRAVLAVKCTLCVLLGFTTVFSDMRPFSVGFYAAMFSIESWAACLVATVAGLFAADISSAWMYAATVIMTTVVFAVSDIKENLLKRSIYCSLFFALFRAVHIFFTGVSLYAVMALVLETLILSGSIFISAYGYPLFLNPGKRTFISGFERMCTFAFTAMAILSLQNIDIYSRINLSSVATILYIYILSFSASAENAAVFGTVMGVITAMNNHPGSDVAGMFAFGALLASMFGKYKKPGVVFGFALASTAFSLLISQYSRVYSVFIESLVAAVIFFILPEKAITYFSGLFTKSDILYDNKTMRQKIRKDDFTSLKKMSESFRELSRIYLGAVKDKMPGSGYYNSKFRTVSDRVCNHCPSRNKCFNPKNRNTNKLIADLFEISMHKGGLSTVDLPEPLKQICHRKDSFVYAFNSMMDVVNTEKMWLGKINESRRLVSDQLSAVATAIDRVCEAESLKLNPELEEKLRAILDKNRIYPLGINAYTDVNGDFCIYISFREGYITPEAKQLTQKCIDSAVYSSSRFVSAEKNGTEITFLYCPMRKYSANFGYASKAKYGEKISGDSFNVIAPDKKSVIMSLSDGMGSGEKAQNESKIVIELLGKFLKAGFDCDTAVKLINSSLLLRSSKESFATIDMCNINLNDHSITFTKLGAANAYIKTSDGVSVVRGQDLPAGILREIEIEKHMLPISSDTVIVMVSDGVGDTVLKSENNDDWIENVLLTLDTGNPQIIAARLLETAYKLEKNTPADDMTVLVACVYDNEV